MKRHRPIEPVDDRPLLERATAALVHEGCPKPDAGWLASALMDGEVLPAQHAAIKEGELTFPALCRLEHFARHFKTATDRDTAILQGFDTLGVADRPYERAVNYGPWPFFEPEARRFLTLCTQHGVNFSDAFRRVGHLSKHPPGLAKTLATFGALDIAAQIDWRKFDSVADLAGWWPSGHGSAQAAEEDRDPTTLVFWLARVGSAALAAVTPRIEKASGEDLVRLARAAARSIGTWLMRPDSLSESFGPTGYLEKGEEFATAAQRIFDVLDERVSRAPGTAEMSLKVLWFRFALMSFDRHPETMDPVLRRRVYNAASDEIGRMRPIFRSAAEPMAATRFAAVRDHYDCCIGIVFGLGTLWEALKPVLLAFCALRAQAVAPDLRFWCEQERDGKEQPAWLAWSVVPMNIAAAIHNCSGREQKHDADLESARTEFAEFCLEKLKTSKRRRDDQSQDSAADPVVASALVEPDPNWRECLVRAVRELRVNPAGKGHHILHHASQHDPDDRVKEAAKVAYAELRRGWSASRKVSPRTMLLAAFWWLRQAHLLSLDIDVDADGAQRTRDQERRRTTEPEVDPGV